MNQTSYVFIMMSPFIVVLVVFLVVVLISWCKQKPYANMLLECIVINAFIGILKEKMTEDGKVVTYFDKEKLLLRSDEELEPKVKRGLRFVSFVLAINILQLFGAFLFIKSRNYCDETLDCFLVDGSSKNPVSCAYVDQMKGKHAVVCYEIVFDLPLAAGLCYGIFKTCTVAMAVATTIIMSLKLSPEKIVFSYCPTITQISFMRLVVSCTCVVGALLTIIFIKGPLHVTDWEEVSAKATVILSCGITGVFVYVMPWEELVECKKSKETAADQQDLATPASMVEIQVVEGLN